MEKAGIFITFEGSEGVGKSTHIRTLKDDFDNIERELIITREPGGTEVGEQLRNIVKHHVGEEPIVDATELLLFAASRAQHVHNLIMPALARGAIVCCDRYVDSTTAYQGYGRGLDLDFIIKLNNLATGGCMPNLSIVLDLTPEQSFERRSMRQAALFDQEVEDRIEAESMAFYERVRNGFLKIAENEPKRVKVINADRTQKEVHNDIMKAIQNEFKLF